MRQSAKNSGLKGVARRCRLDISVESRKIAKMYRLHERVATNNSGHQTQKTTVMQRKASKQIKRKAPKSVVGLFAVIFLALVSIGKYFGAHLNDPSWFLPSSSQLNQYSDSNKFELAKQESFGFFDDIDEREWKMLQRRARSVHPNTRGNPLQGDQLSGLWFQNHYEPNFTCRHEQRIGNLGDGGKWVCDPHRLSDKKDCLVYSVGSRGDADFEAAVQTDIGRHCEIHVFDFGNYADKVQQQAPGAHYHQWGIGDKPSNKFKTLKETVKVLGHTNRTVDIFKIDCEGT